MASSSSRKKRLRGGEDSDLCRHDFEDNVLESSRDSIEDIEDEISMSNPSELRDSKISNCPKDMHLKPERWKYKTRKKRKKTEELSDGTRVFDDNQTVNINIVENNVEMQRMKTKYIKMNKAARQSQYGRELYKIINSGGVGDSNGIISDPIKIVKNGLDSTGNSETQSSSSDDNKRRLKHAWKVKTATQECDICGKEMLRSRMKKHVKLAHKSKRIYPCDECSFNAENLVELKKHLRKRHKLSIGTVNKMIKVMKLNRKHRMSVLEDEGEAEPARVRRAASLGGSRIIQDELHQTSDSELERRARTGVRANYKEISFDDDDWNEALNDDTSSETSEESLEDSNEDEEVEAAETKDESHDSGRETQTNTEMSADEAEVSKPDQVEEKVVETEEDIDKKLEDLVAGMRILTEEERAKPGEKYYSKQQKELLFSYFNIRNTVTKEHQELLGFKVGIEPKRVYFWFDNSRRIQLKNAQRAKLAEKTPDKNVVGEREKRSRKPRAVSPPPMSTSRSAVIANNKSGTVLEYDESLIIRSSRTVEDILNAGDEALCIGVDISPQHQRCLICSYSCSFRGNLYKHLRQHDFEPKFCALPRAKTELGPEVKGCRKSFSLETFDLHVCNSEVPQCFGDDIKMDKRFKSGAASSCYSSGEDEEEEEDGDGSEEVEAMRKEGGGVCLGYEVNDSCTKCLLCEASMPCRANIYKHINTHGYAIKFCSIIGREKSDLSDPTARGCRKIFIEDTFDDHVCNETVPEQIGFWPLKRNQGKRKKIKGGGTPKKVVRSGFRGFEKHFGTPDGSPAKYYNDRYTRLFHQLAVRTNIGVTLDTTFVRNGKMELCYLSDRQMTAVKDYIDDNDAFELVSLRSSCDLTHVGFEDRDQ